MTDYADTIMPEPLMEYWVGLAPGAFSVAHLTRKMDLQQLYIDMCERLVQKGTLEHYNDLRGWYVPRRTDLVELDYVNTDAHEVDLWLPFEISDIVEIHEGNVIIISGAPNSGKTALFLNIIKENRHKGWDIHYFSSEMGAAELQKRLKKFPDIAISQWGFKAYRRSENFHDVIKKGPNSLNLIDFMEVHDEFYKIGKAIKKVHDALDGAIAIIGLQKNPGNDQGLGGYRTMEVTRLAVALDYGKIKITKAKNFRNPEKNPNGKMKDFKLVAGCQIIANDGWYMEKL